MTSRLKSVCALGRMCKYLRTHKDNVTTSRDVMMRAPASAEFHSTSSHLLSPRQDG